MASAVLVELKASSTEFMAKMGEARAEVAKLGTEGSSHFSKLQAVGKAAFLGIAGVATAVGGVSLEMADKFEQANARLETAVKNSGGSFEQLKPMIDAVNTQMGKFGYTSTETESALAGLTAATHNPAKSLGEMSLAADIARGRNISLSDATALLTKVQTGHVALLGRLGIAVKDASGHIISQQAAMAKLAALYGGAASRNAETFAGKTQALKAQMTNLSTQLGMALVPILERVASVTETVVNWFERHRTTAEALAAVIGGVLTITIAAWVAGVVAGAAASVASFATMLASAATWAAGMIASAVSVSIAWVAAMAPILASAIATAAGIIIAFAPLILGLAAVGVAAYLLYSNWTTVWNGIKAAFDAVWSAIKTVFTAVVSFIKEHAAVIVGAIMLIAPPIGIIIVAVHELYTHWSTVWNAIKTVTSAVAGVLKTIFGAIAGAGLDVIRAGVSALQTVWGAAWGAIKTVASGAWSVLSPVFHAIVNVGIALVKREIQGLQTVWSDVWNGILTVVDAIWSVLEPIFNTIKTAIHDITGGLGKVASVAGKIGGAVGGIGHLVGFASGTDYAPGGLARIDELGGEVVDLPRGSRVYPHGVTPPGGGGDVHIHINVAGSVLTPVDLANAVHTGLLQKQRRTGALGLT